MRTNVVCWLLLLGVLMGLRIPMSANGSGLWELARHAAAPTRAPDLHPAHVVAYLVEQRQVGDLTEYRFWADEHHFMTLVDEQGTLNLRPRPGRDINGWGSSWYAQPFLPGAEMGHTVIDLVQATAGGIQVIASGSVSRGASSTYGTWDVSLFVAYDPTERVITGTGTYTIALPSPLDATTGDLNLYRIASNYLHNVPLLHGDMGDTGDMAVARVGGQGMGLTWLPPQSPAHFPTDRSPWLSIDVVGAYNVVDTAAQGYARIEPAIKPSLQVTLTAHHPEVEMMFGALYDTSVGQDFWEDNIGITPLIPHASDATLLAFDVGFESRAIEHHLMLPMVTRPSAQDGRQELHCGLPRSTTP